MEKLNPSQSNQELKSLDIARLTDFLNEKVLEYNRKEFIGSDPIQIPHGFSRKQDIEIAGFFAAILAWGQRPVIISKCKDLMHRMDNAPFEFIVNHQPADLKVLTGFVHRTFNGEDALYFATALQQIYRNHGSLEDAFLSKESGQGTKTALSSFNRYFFSFEPEIKHARKHVSNPDKGSTCKRLNMYLRWMVRKDNQQVDFGIWNKIKMADLHIPLDVHVERVARKLGLLQRTQVDWKAVEELTQNLKRLDPNDPVKYDYALFGLGVFEKF